MSKVKGTNIVKGRERKSIVPVEKKGELAVPSGRGNPLDAARQISQESIVETLSPAEPVAFLVKGKTRLNILVMLTPLFHGAGPHHFSPKHTWPYRGLLVGLDPVAVDSTGVRILAAKREAFFGEERPLSPPAKHIQLADTRHHLGNANPASIELVKLGWDDGVLI